VKTTDVDMWLKSGKYLPNVLRDFHYQKDVFKAMHEIIREDTNSHIKRPTWVDGQCYVIDVFLWFMARRGYTLQRTKRRGNFRDIDTDVQTQKKLRDAENAKALGLKPLNSASDRQVD
jgi:hypothetical protein